ncbi:MAG: lysophospholipid acyltransferase family protein [Pseudomonadota bacterium]
MNEVSFVGDLSDRGPTRVRVSRWRQCVAIPALLAWLVVIPPAFLLARLLGRRPAEAMALRFHRGVCRIFNLKIRVEGTPSEDRPTLFVANHASYIDVFVLGSLVPGVFVAKADVAQWPVFGKLAALQNTVFIERNPRRTAAQIPLLKARLAGAENLFIFPEGTSTDGTRVRPFRPSLLAAALDPTVAVQPVTIAYRRYEGQPMLPADRDFYAWYLPMTFVPHFLNVMGLGVAEVTVRFHPLVEGESDRKLLAQRCYASVAGALSELVPSAAAGQPTDRQ